MEEWGCCCGPFCDIENKVSYITDITENLREDAHSARECVGTYLFIWISVRKRMDISPALGISTDEILRLHRIGE